MHFDRVPNEILQQIFSSLSFQDALRLARVCRRFYHIIINNFSNYAIDILRPGEVIADGKCKLLPATSTSIIALHRGRVDLVVSHPFNKNLYRIVTRPFSRHDSPVCVIPNSPSIVHYAAIGRRQNRLAIYNLVRYTVVAERETRLSVESIVCSQHHILVHGKWNGLRTNDLYSWDGRGRLELQRNIIYDRFPSMSAIGMLAHQRMERSRQICLFDCNSGQEMDPVTATGEGEVDTIGYEVCQYVLSACGRLIATTERVSTYRYQAAVYDVTTNETVFRHDISADTYLCNSHTLSDELRFLVLQASDSLAIFDLRTGKISVNLPSAAEYCIGFRHICGECCFAFMNFKRQLQYARFDEAAGQWQIDSE